MALLRNAFRYRLADRPTLDTGLFLHLYCPALLNRIVPEDLSIPKLVVFSGSPGSGKSSFLRLFQTESLIALHAHRLESKDDVVAEALRELAIFDDDGIRYVGLYIQCDSNLRLLSTALPNSTDQKLLNTLLDVRITLAYLRGLRQLSAASLIPTDLDGINFAPLPSEDTPPPLFAAAHSFAELERECLSLEMDFAALLNSFPGDPIPKSLVPHSQLFALSYISHQLKVGGLVWPTPLLLLDDFQDLYEEQREHLQRELIRRSAVPRWVAVRKHVYELERLLPLEGTRDGREVREIDLDDSKQAAFRKFLENVTERRVRMTESLQPILTIQSFKERLKIGEDAVAWSKMSSRAQDVLVRLQALGANETIALPTGPEVSLRFLHDLEKHLILAERKAGRSQRYLLAELEPPEPSDAKTDEAARLFMAARYNLPYYFGFDALSTASNRNVEQFLDIAGGYAEKMIFRAELNRSFDLKAREQDDLLRASAKRYYARIEQGYAHGYTIRQFIDNLGRFFSAVTHRPNAPIAPGVTGFGLTREQLRDARTIDGANSGIRVFREALTAAVAGNIFAIRKTKQGQAGSEKFVFYLNRLLCIYFNLPLGYGGWQRLPIETIVKMMTGPIAADELGKKWQMQPIELEEPE
jgi:hypothetical protein